MSTSVVEILKSLVTPSLLNTVGSATGLPNDLAGRGLGELAGQYLGALVHQAGDRDTMANVAEMANAVSRDTSGINDIKGLLAGGIPSTMAVLAGNRLMGSLFGVWQSSVVHKIAGSLGVAPAASSSLFNLAAPLVLSAISKRLGGALTGPALAGLLNQERNALLGGLGSLASGAVAAAKSAPAAVAKVAPAAAPAAVAAAASAARHSDRDTGLFASFLWLLLPLAFIGWLAWQKLNEPPAEPPPAAAPAAEAPAAPAPVAAEPAPAAAPAPAPALARIALANGAEINATAEGVETKLINFINDQNAEIDKSIWFNFDRLTFETGSSNIAAESKEQIDNIVAILNAYPAVKIKIGGYTDNVGDPQANLDLSGVRATKVMETIVAAGVAADRVEAEGYGDQFPIADNSTEEGRAQNRRTAVSVRAK
ncbi:MAG: OmpA family protein [Hyphomicrobium sp.]|jgi:outer membrane protein OmpA-like peptidoglycan-associated protein|nr:OmpA family protein [Hyphomicrobium sp.]